MIKSLVISFIISFGYFSIQYFAGWMIFMPGLQQITIFLYGIIIYYILFQMFKRVFLFNFIIPPFLSLIALMVIYEMDLEFVYGISLLNFIAYIASFFISKLFLKNKILENR